MRDFSTPLGLKAANHLTNHGEEIGPFDASFGLVWFELSGQASKITLLLRQKTPCHS